MISLPPDFDPDIYLSMHEDVKNAGVDPKEHYINYGQKEGRKYLPHVKTVVAEKEILKKQIINFDDIKIHQLVESPKRSEEVVVSQQFQANEDPVIENLLRSIFLEADRGLAFNRFLVSNEFLTILKLLKIFNISAEKTLCEIGAGPGFLSWALMKSGYKVDLLEPNDSWNTGTGYLQSRNDSASIKIFNNIKEWYIDISRYDVVVTKNCIHHFPNISLVAGSIRQKMKPGAYWFAFREWYADTADELYMLLKNHPYCQQFELYDWPYPASHYVDSIQIAGFKLEAIVPYDYANNCLGTYSEDEENDDQKVYTKNFDRLLQSNPADSVINFWDEVKKNKYEGGFERLYSRPQLMLFRRSLE